MNVYLLGFENQYQFSETDSITFTKILRSEQARNEERFGSTFHVIAPQHRFAGNLHLSVDETFRVSFEMY